jgi:hypothetical protein
MTVPDIPPPPQQHLCARACNPIFLIPPNRAFVSAICNAGCRLHASYLWIVSWFSTYELAYFLGFLFLKISIRHPQHDQQRQTTSHRHLPDASDGMNLKTVPAIQSAVDPFHTGTHVVEALPFMTCPVNRSEDPFIK